MKGFQQGIVQRHSTAEHNMSQAVKFDVSKQYTIRRMKGLEL